MLTVTLITRDEADRVGAALASVAFADELLVLDSGSTDGTVAVAEAAGARVLRTDWPGHVAQKNRALAEARHPWVFGLDADEVVDEALAAALRSYAGPAAPSGPSSSPAGLRVLRVNRWLGHEVRGGAFRPEWKLRLVHKDRARWEGDDPHDHLACEGPVADLPGRLLHTPYRSLAEHLATIDRYTARAAAVARAAGRRGTVLDLLVRPPWHLVRALVLQGGLRDGAVGLVLAGLGALYVLLKWARVRGELPS